MPNTPWRTSSFPCGPEVAPTGGGSEHLSRGRTVAKAAVPGSRRPRQRPGCSHGKVLGINTSDTPHYVWRGGVRREVEVAPRGDLRGSQEAPDATRQTLAGVCGGRAKYLTERSGAGSEEEPQQFPLPRSVARGSAEGGATGADGLKRICQPSLCVCVGLEHDFHKLHRFFCILFQEASLAVIRIA